MKHPLKAALAALKTVLPLAGLTLALASAPSAFAQGEPQESYDSRNAGHPLRIAAYAAHPVGVILDRLIFRPAWWLGSKEPIRTLVGRRPLLPEYRPTAELSPENPPPSP